MQYFYCFAGKYWHGLYVDYKDVAFDVAKDCRERPVRAAMYITSAYHFLNGLQITLLLRYDAHVYYT